MALSLFEVRIERPCSPREGTHSTGHLCGAHSYIRTGRRDLLSHHVESAGRFLVHLLISNVKRTEPSHIARRTIISFGTRDLRPTLSMKPPTVGIAIVRALPLHLQRKANFRQLLGCAHSWKSLGC